MGIDKIPLLSKKSFTEMEPKEFKEMVVGLYWKPEPKTKKEKKPFTYSINKKGNVVLRINRKPKWITEDEIEQIAKESNTSAEDLYKKVNKKNSDIKLVTTDDKNQLSLFDLTANNPPE